MRSRVLPVGAIAVVTIITACNGGGAAETSTSTSTTESTTTTTTLPPGLQPQQVTYGFSADDLAKYNYTQTATVSIPEDSIPDEYLPGAISFTFTASGEMWQLSVPGPTGDTFELIGDLQTKAGTVAGDIGGFSFSQELEEADLADLTYLFPPLVFNMLGMPTDDIGGAPGYFRGAPNPLDILIMPGPPLSEHEIDVGDTWTASLDYSALGSVTYQAEVVDEVETDDGYAFSIEYTAEAPTLPIELTLDDAFAITGSAASQEDVADLLQIAGAADPDFVVRFTAFDVSGTSLFEPGSGRILEATTAFSVDEEIEWTADDVAGTMAMTVGASFEIELLEADEATGVERDAMLARFKTDPYDLAYQQLYDLWMFDLQYPPAEDIEALFTLIEETRADIFAGFAFADAGIPDDDSEDSALVVAITLGGDLRGSPTLAEDLAWYWIGYQPARMTILDTTAYRFTVDGREWFLWSDRTHLFLVSGRIDIARSVMETLVARGEPYFWETGDCLGFEDEYASGTPYAPFGVYGLRHCLDEHTYEVTHSEVRPDGPDAAYPDDELWNYAQARCAEVYYEYVGVHELQSSIASITYVPDEDEWARGDRYVACVITQRDADGSVAVEGRLEGRGEDTAVEYEKGTCLAWNFPVPCSDPHDGEIVEIGEYPAGPDEPMPDWDEASDLMDGVCVQALEDYEVEEGDFDVEVESLSYLVGGWQFGIRDFYCVAYAVDDDGWGIDVVGSFTDEWEEAPEQIET